MQPRELKELRQQLGLDRLQFARLIGYTGTDRNDEMRIREFERGKRQVPLHIARFADLIHRWHLMFKGLPDFPDWPGYDYSHEPDPQHTKEPIDG
jgi:transcriptional regulator with XRE-family HTH domain